MKKITKATLAALCCASMGLAAAGLAACGETGAKQYNVIYAGDGVSVTQPIVVEEDGLLVKPEDPTREHYTFDGWYNGETKWNFEADKVTENVTLTAKWTAKVYVIKFMSEDMETVIAEKTYTVETISAFQAPAVPDAPAYCTNGKWSKTPEEYLIYSETPITVMPVYEYMEYNVTFMDGETQVATQKVGGGLNVTQPQALTKDYYTFDGWYNGETKWDFANDVVEGELTLTAKWTAIEYTVKFLSYDGSEYQTLTYTAENKNDFAFPSFPDLQGGATNPRWNKTLAECLVFSTEAIIVTAECDYVKYTVAFVNTGSEIPSEEISWGSKVAMPEQPVLDGYVFNGWTVNGVAYDFDTPVTGDLTLAASWLALTTEKGEKSVILTAEQVKDQVVRAQADYLAVDGVIDNEDWYFDTDYPDYGLGGSVEKGTVLAKSVKYSTDASNFTHTITLPLINYTLYTKVDFAWQSGGAISEMKVNGTEIAVVGNRTISIVTDENGTRAIVYVAMQPVSNNPAITINLSEAVATGKEGLTLSFKSNGYMWMEISQFHGTAKKTVDYQAKMAEALAKLPATVEGLTYSNEEKAAAAEYLAYAKYMTAYEQTLSIPEVIEALAFCKVTFNVNGNMTEQTAELGKALKAPATPVLDGYVFKGWLLNGEVYDVSTPLTGDMTLVAGWAKVTNTAEKSVILTAEQVQAQTVRVQELIYLGIDGIKTNPTWSFDSDYLVDWKGTTDQLFEKAVRYSTDAKNHTHTLVLPKLNYSLYSKVDFAIQSEGVISNITIGGTVVEYKKNLVVSVRTDENGTSVYVYEMNVGAQNPTPIVLSQAVATGEEGLTISFTSNGYMWLNLSQFHGTSKVVDYTAKMASILAQLPQTVEGLTYSEAEKALAAQYLTYAAYMTDYEKSVYVEPAVIAALKA